MAKGRVLLVILDKFRQEPGITVNDLMKVDVQGMELKVLDGASCMLESGAFSTIFIELNWLKIARGWVGEDVVERLSELCYGFMTRETAWQLRPRGDWVCGCSGVIAEKGATGR